MATARTGGMTAIGVLNIVFGTIGTLLMVVVVLLGGLLAAGGAAMEAEAAAADAEGMGTMVAAGGGIIAVMGIIGLLASAALAVSGIGVLKLAPWGRILTMVCGGSICGLQVLSMLQGFSITSLLVAGYGAMLIGLFMKPEWKAAFVQGGAPVPVDSIDEVDSDFRAAA